MFLSMFYSSFSRSLHFPPLFLLCVSPIEAWSCSRFLPVKENVFTFHIYIFMCLSSRLTPQSVTNSQERLLLPMKSHNISHKTKTYIDYSYSQYNFHFSHSCLSKNSHNEHCCWTFMHQTPDVSIHNMLMPLGYCYL